MKVHHIFRPINMRMYLKSLDTGIIYMPVSLVIPDNYRQLSADDKKMIEFLSPVAEGLGQNYGEYWS